MIDSSLHSMNLAFIGPPGSGKGTQATLLWKDGHADYMGTGRLFRENLNHQSALGLLARDYMTRGELVPNEVVDAMVEEWLRKSNPSRPFILDGFPRTVDQARFLDRILEELNRPLDAVVYLHAGEDTIMRRLPRRLVCRDCQATYHPEFHPPARGGACDECGGVLYRRDDDQSALISKRLQVYERFRGPVLRHYQRGARLILVRGEAGIEEVQEVLRGKLNDYAKRGFSDVSVAELQGLHIPKTTTITPPVSSRKIQSPDLVLLGGPGSGKGTQAEFLCSKLNVPHISTGDLFRENMKKKTRLGRLVTDYMDAGDLVPDEITESMVEERLAREDTLEGFVLDGFPRTLPQAMALGEMLSHLKRRLAAVLYLDVSEETIIRRLSGRLICGGCQAPFHKDFHPPKTEGHCDHCGGPLIQRKDDNPETVRKRIRTYNSQTRSLVDYFEAAGVLHRIDGSGDPKAISAQMMKVVEGLPLDR